MMLFWKIRYFDRTDKQFKDRCLSLDTTTLDPTTRAAVELVAENRSPKIERDIFKYRHLFIEGNLDAGAKVSGGWDKFLCVGPTEYFEDETGKEITQREMGPLLTGNPDAILLRHELSQHDLEYMQAEPKPIPVAEISLTTEEVRLLGYFCRDLQELMESPFMKDGAGSWGTGGLKTAASDAEIRSYVTIFRRLYMTGPHDPASYSKVVPIFTKALGDHPLSKWVAGAEAEYQRHLQGPPDFHTIMKQATWTFSVKRLIDVFLYTQYAHQPDDKRQRQFNECLKEVKGDQDYLTWLFLSQIWWRGMEMYASGKVIVGWFKRYCAHHGITPPVLDSLSNQHAGIGSVEKEEAKTKRLFEEKIEQLALSLHEEHGKPPGGHHQFLAAARQQLGRKLQEPPTSA